MILDCPACGARYRLADDAIPAEGKSVRCAKCLHRWWQQAPALPQPPAEPSSIDLPAPLDEADEPASPIPARAFALPPLDMPDDFAAKLPPPERASPIAFVPEFADEPPPVTTPVSPRPAPQAAAAAPMSSLAPPEPAAARPALPDTPAADSPPADPPAVPPAALPDVTPARRVRGPWLILGGLIAVAAVTAAALTQIPGLPPFDPAQVPVIGGWLDAQLNPPAPPPSPLRLAANAQFSALANGTRIVALTGEIINPTAISQPVPAVEALLIDDARAVAGRWRIAPPAALIAPGARLRFDGSASGFPASVTRVTLRFDAAR